MQSQNKTVMAVDQSCDYNTGVSLNTCFIVSYLHNMLDILTVLWCSITWLFYQRWRWKRRWFCTFSAFPCVFLILNFQVGHVPIHAKRRLSANPALGPTSRSHRLVPEKTLTKSRIHRWSPRPCFSHESPCTRSSMHANNPASANPNLSLSTPTHLDLWHFYPCYRGNYDGTARIETPWK